jgi:RecJ-like exonuclease
MSCAGDDAERSEAMRRSGAMSTDPQEIRARIDALLAELPDPANSEKMPTEADLEELARRLSEAHDMLVQALESAEKS